MSRPSRLLLFGRRAAEVALSLVFATVVVHHVTRGDFRPLVALTVPLLVVFYGFASVLFVRSGSLTSGPWKTRSRYAGEASMQAAVWHLLGIVLGLATYSLLRNLGLGGLWQLLFVAPYVLMQVALLRFLHSVWTVFPDLLGTHGRMAMVRRISARAK